MVSALLPIALLKLSVALAIPVEGDIFGDRMLLRAREALEQGDHRSALEAALKALAKLPATSDMAAQARFFAARSALQLGQNDVALRHLRRLDQSLPELQDFIFHYRAHAHRGRGAWSKALRWWQKLSTTYPDSPLHSGAVFSIGDAYYALDKKRAAAAAYDRAVELYPKDDRATAVRFTRAKIAEDLEQWTDAADRYRSIALRRPLDAFAEPALARLTELVERSRVPSPRPIDYLRRIDRLLSARAVKQARVDYQKLEDSGLDSKYSIPLADRRARIAYRSDDFETALDEFLRLAEHTRGSQRAHYRSWASRSLAALSRFDDAVDVYIELAEQHAHERSGANYLYKGAWLAYNGGDYARSRQLFKAYAKHHPRGRDRADVAWFIAWNSYRLGELELASKQLSQFRRRFQGSELTQRSFYWQARIAERSGEHAQAVELYRQTIACDPENYYAIYADRRLSDLQEDNITTEERRVYVASLDVNDLPFRNGSPPSPDATHDFLLRGSEVFDWQSSAGRRAIRLMTLGYLNEASDIVRELDTRPDVHENDIHYPRARLLFELGDYHSAFRITAQHLRDEARYSRRVREMLYPLAHRQLLENAEREWGLSPLLLSSVIRQESAFDDRARSWASARGLMQIIAPTASRIAEALDIPDFHPGLLNDPKINVRFGSWYLRALLRSYRGNAILALGGYNAGPVALNRWLEARHTLEIDEFVEEIPYSETRSYIKRIVANLDHYHELYGGRFDPPRSLEQPLEDGIRF